ncbi:hypothetical protein [Leptolyngbya sp. 'hensonii']|nr:hypothetical protein [Leptolyngbya sp. 'hensonii']
MTLASLVPRLWLGTRDSGWEPETLAGNQMLTLAGNQMLGRDAG